MKRIDFAVIGGDVRMAMLAKMLEKQYTCRHLLLSDGGLPDCIAAKTAILPVPCSLDGRHLNCAVQGLALSDVTERINADCILGGRIPGDIRTALTARGARVLDLLEDEALLIKNAELTAEGALGIIINETSRAVLGTRILILGYGRVGRALARVLRALGAEVLVGARDPTQLASAECEGCTPVPLAEIGTALHGTQVVCNTVPASLLDAPALASLGKDALFIELASGGFNAKNAETAGVRFINAQGLPGKTAPESAAQIIYDRITDLLLRQI